MSNSTADKFVGKQITPPETINPLSLWRTTMITFNQIKEWESDVSRTGQSRQLVAELEKQLAEARVIIRRLANVIEMGGEQAGPLADADEWLLKE